MDSHSKADAATKAHPEYSQLVPHYMRTKRFTPRMIASFLVLISCIILLWGGQALARIQASQNKTAFTSLQAGASYYTIAAQDTSADCLASLELNLNPKKKLQDSSEVKAKAKFRIGSQAQSYPIDISASLRFDELGELNKLALRFNLASVGFLNILGGSYDTPLTATLQSSTGASQTLSLFAPGRIYLLEPKKGAYRIRFPRSFNGLTTQLPAPTQYRLALQESSAQAHDACFSSLQQASAPTLLEMSLTNKHETLLHTWSVLEQLTQRGLHDKS